MMQRYKEGSLDKMVGMVFSKVYKGKFDFDAWQWQPEAQDSVFFEGEDGSKWVLTHEQDCCEEVWLEDVDGDLDDLVGVPLTLAEAVSSTEEGEELGSTTWTYYKFCGKGHVTLRWCGKSNGYYSERVDLFVEDGVEK